MNSVDTSEITRYKPLFESPFFNAGPMVCFIWNNDDSWSVEAVSKNIKDNFGYQDKDFLSSKVLYAEIIHKDDLQRVSDEVTKACEDKKSSFEHEPYRALSSSGEYRWVKDTTMILYNQDQEITHFVGYIVDISALKQTQAKLQNTLLTLEDMLNTDSLTKLGSRDKLHRDLNDTSYPCLVLINIDRFSQINDFYGHEFGDKVLQAFSQTLQSEIQEKCVYPYDLYRYGGDEFAVRISKYEKEEILDIFLSILEKIERDSIYVEGREININLSCGVSFEGSSEALLSADMALKISKKEQKSLVVFSEQNSLNQQYKDNLFWAGKIKLAIEQNRVVPFFQPIVDNKNLGFHKYEALVRIIKTNGDIVPPFSFLDIAKQTKQYLQLTKIMIEKSFATFKEQKDLEFSVNLTIEDIFCPDMQNYLFEKLDQNPDIAKRLVLEIVESESIEDYEQIIEFIKVVKSKGCKIAIDDFGSGYSNFEYLVKLQADYIKIDGSLIRNINTQRESYVVVSTIVNFAKQMGIKTIAEYIEDEEILKTTKKLGIDYSQGYHFSPPRQELII